MSAPIPNHHFLNIKTLTLAVAGITKLTPDTCKMLSFLIMDRTHFGISEITIKRLYGFAEGKFNPSLYTLNALSVFCGYESWNDFIKLRPEILHENNNAEDIISDPLFDVLLQAATPTLILKANASDFTILSYNCAYQDVTHTKARILKGKSFWEVFDPLKAGSAGPTILLVAFHEAIYENKTVQMEPLHYDIPSELFHVAELCWWDVKIMPVAYNSLVKYLVVQVKNITEKILRQDAIDEAILKELTMAENLAVKNVQLNVAVEKLGASHNELANAKKILEDTNQTLEQRIFERSMTLFESEARQRQLIDNAPVAIGVLKGPNYVIETANKKMIDVWGKGNGVINQELAVALPEIEGQPIISLLDEVRRTGNAYVNPELRGMLNINGILQARYFDLVYQPVKLSSGVIEAIFVLAVDITDHVFARKRLERTESILRLAVTAAKIGIWSYQPKEPHLIYDSTFADILGWENERRMTYQEVIEGITTEFRERVKLAIENAINNAGIYNISYRFKRFNDGKIVCLKGTGKLSISDSGEGEVFSGVISEIHN